MTILLTIENNTYDYNRQNKKYKKFKKIGDEKLWKI